MRSCHEKARHAGLLFFSLRLTLNTDVLTANDFGHLATMGVVAGGDGEEWSCL